MVRRAWRSLLPPALLAAVLLQATVHAQPVPPPPPPPPPPGQKSAAEILYEEAWAAMEEKDYATACAKFTASYEVSKATGPLQGLARCEEGLGHLARALAHWRTLLARLPPTSPTKPEAETNAKRLEAKVGKLRLELETAAPRPARVAVDGAAVELAGQLEVPVDPDVDHEVRASFEGRPDHVQTVRVASGAVRGVIVNPQPREVTQPTPPQPASGDDGAGLRTAGLVAGGVGLATAVVAVVTGIVMLGAESDVDEACGDRARCADPEAAEDARARGQDLAVLNGITFATAVLGIGAGVTLFALGSSKGGAESARSGKTTGRGVAQPGAASRWTVRVGPSGAAVRARF